MPIVTISRQFGAGGSSVAAIVAAELGAEIVDKKLIEEVAARLTLEPSQVEAEAERPRTLLERLVRSFSTLEPGIGAGWTPPYPDPLFDPRKEITHLTEQVIREVAAGGNAVIVGRGAGFVLQGNPDVFRVFLRAPEIARVNVLMARLASTNCRLGERCTKPIRIAPLTSTSSTGGIGAIRTSTTSSSTRGGSATRRPPN